MFLTRGTLIILSYILFICKIYVFTYAKKHATWSVINPDFGIRGHFSQISLRILKFFTAYHLKEYLLIVFIYKLPRYIIYLKFYGLGKNVIWVGQHKRGAFCFGYNFSTILNFYYWQIFPTSDRLRFVVILSFWTCDGG